MVNLTSVHNEFKFHCFSVALSLRLGLEVTNTPGTAKVLGSNLTAFFFQTKYSVPKKLYAYVLSPLLPHRN